MNQIYQQQLKRLEKQEQRMLDRQEIPLIKSRITPLVDKIQDKIPEKLKSTLVTAFYKGFQLVFEKGNGYIEKTYNKEQIELDFDVNNYAIDKKLNSKHLKKLDQHSNQAKLLNSSFSALEGGLLGLLGIGLPDIPIFISVMLRTVYEVALSYGFHYDTPEERVYILLLIDAALSKGEKQKEANKELELLGQKLDSNVVSEIDIEKQMKTTADVLSDALLTAKFIQGIPVVGAVGGVVNYSILNRVSKYAGIKYKKRYLLKKELD